MIGLLLITHVTLLSLSLLITMGSVFTVIVGYKVPKLLLAMNLAGTTVGIVAGIILLMSAPLDAKCAILLTYLLVFVTAQVFVGRRNQLLSSSVV